MSDQERIAKLEVRQESDKERLNRLEKRYDDLFGELFDKLNKYRGEIKSWQHEMALELDHRVADLKEHIDGEIAKAVKPKSDEGMALVYAKIILILIAVGMALLKGGEGFESVLAAVAKW